MNKALFYSIGLMVAFALGFATAHVNVKPSFAEAEQKTEKPAYVIVSVDNVQEDKLGPYREAAIPAAEKAGFEYVAAGTSDGTVHVLEGSWPYTGTVAIEKFNSMDALLDFWNSPVYQKAKKLREGLMDVNFIIAIDSI